MYADRNKNAPATRERPGAGHQGDGLMSDETLPAYAALKEACEKRGLEVVGTTCDGGVIVAADLEATKRAVEVFGGRRVPLQPDLTIVFGKRS